MSMIGPGAGRYIPRTCYLMFILPRVELHRCNSRAGALLAAGLAGTSAEAGHHPAVEARRLQPSARDPGPGRRETPDGSLVIQEGPRSLLHFISRMHRLRSQDF